MWHGAIESRIGQDPSLAIEQDYASQLKSLRDKDRALEATSIGPHRSDAVVTYREKNMPAHECSTGEQKALLGSLFLAHTRLIRDEWGEAPVLLLDEVMAHLDAARRDQFASALLDLGAQIFITATSKESAGAAMGSCVITVQDGRVRESTNLNQKIRIAT